MPVFERAEAFFVSRIAFPGTNYLLNRKNIIAQHRRLRSTEYAAPELIGASQLDKLRQVIKHAYTNTPFYRNAFRAVGLRPEDILSLTDIKKVPPLARQDLIDHRLDLVDERRKDSAMLADNSSRRPGEPIPFAPFRGHPLVRNTSSGSTGAPTIFYEDGAISALNWALELRLKSWFGIAPGAREARMVRLSTDNLAGSRTSRLRNRLWNQLILPGVNLTDENYAECVAKLLAYRPKVLWGFTSALAGLAEYIRKNASDRSPFGIRLVVGWAAPVYDHERKLLEEVFACPVSNIYGARETGHIAGRCPCGTLHINHEHFFVENAADTGELLVTPLDITPMPFIRYRMGDIGTVVPSSCGCGRTLQVIENLLGRTGEVFKTKDGRMISPNFWCRTFMHQALSNAVKRFQVIYKKNDLISIRMVRSTAYDRDAEFFLTMHLRENFHPDMKIEFDYVDEIKPLISGKYQMVVNEMRP